MTADIITLNDFRRDDAGPAKTPTSKHEPRSQTFWQPPFVTLPDPLPKDWGEFWKASDLWWRRRQCQLPVIGVGADMNGLWHR